MTKKKIKIQQNILLIFLLAGLTILLFVKLISVSMADTRVTDFIVNNTYEIDKRMDNIAAGTAQSESAVRAYLTTGDKRWYESLDETQQQGLHLIQEVRTRLQDTLQQQRLAGLETALKQKIVFQQTFLKDGGRAALAQQRGSESEDRLTSLYIQTILKQFMQRQALLLEQRLSASNRAKNKVLLIAMTGTGLIFIFITGILLRLNRDVRRRKAAEQEIRESEGKYRQLIEEAGVTLFTADLTGIFTYVSSRCEALTGFTAAELTGKSFAMLVLPDSIEQVVAQYQKQVSTLQKESIVEFPIVTREGHLKWVEQHAVLQVNEFLKPTGYQCVVKDITEKKKAEQLLKDADQKIRAMLASTTEGFYMIDPDYKVSMINKAGQDILQMASGKRCKLGDSILDFTDPEKEELFQDLFKSPLPGSAEEEEIHLQTSQGERWFHNSYFAVQGKDQKVMAICTSSKDITERKLAEKALNKVRAEREEYQFRLQSILDNTPAVIFIKDMQGRYLIINKSFREAFGLTNEQVIGKTDFEFDTPVNASRYKEIDDEVIRTLGPVKTEEILSSVKGIQKLLLVKFPLFDKRNNIYGVGGIATEYTDRLAEFKKKVIQMTVAGHSDCEV